MPSDDHNNIPIECLGVTGAVNFHKPDRQDLYITQQLELAINNLDIFESVDETRQRREALIELQDFCNSWIYNKAIDYMYPESVAKSIKGKIFTFGSYRLGVNFKGADIDALLVGPKFISRDEFFDDFVSFLSNNPLAQDVHPVPKAFVPVLKMKFCQVEIDLLFASVDQMSIPHDFCLSDNSEQLLRNMDERDVRSVNGVRVTDDILRLVYDKRVFKASLKIVRFWAKRRCIYSNAMGFIGGVSWAILVARVCQLWPLATVSAVVINFFKFYGLKWRWPSPVVLREVDEIGASAGGLQLSQWDPRVNPADQTHLMPIITPSYPAQNSTYNVGESHKRFIVDQMKNALEVLKQIIQKERPYEDLFKPLFFFKYRHYLVVTLKCADKKEFREQTSLVESKLRLLIQYLEVNMFIAFALLYLRSFDRVEPEEDAKGDDKSQSRRLLVRRWFIGLELRKVEKSLYLVEEISRFKNLVRVDLDVSYSRRSALGQYLPPEVVEGIRERTQRERLIARKRNSDSGGALGSQLGQSETCNNNQEDQNSKLLKTPSEGAIDVLSTDTNEAKIDQPDTMDFDQSNSLKRRSEGHIDPPVDIKRTKMDQLRSVDDDQSNSPDIVKDTVPEVSAEVSLDDPKSTKIDQLDAIDASQPNALTRHGESGIDLPVDTQWENVDQLGSVDADQSNSFNPGTESDSGGEYNSQPEIRSSNAEVQRQCVLKRHSESPGNGSPEDPKRAKINTPNSSSALNKQSAAPISILPDDTELVTIDRLDFVDIDQSNSLDSVTVETSTNKIEQSTACNGAGKAEDVVDSKLSKVDAVSSSSNVVATCSSTQRELGRHGSSTVSSTMSEKECCEETVTNGGQ